MSKEEIIKKLQGKIGVIDLTDINIALNFRWHINNAKKIQECKKK
jgi:hypothetical protein